VCAPEAQVSQLTVAEIMTREVMCTAPDSPLHDVVALMDQKHISCVVVCVETKPVGILSERDLVGVLARLSAKAPLQKLLVGDVMSAPVVSITENTEIDTAIAEVRARRIRRLPIVDSKGRLVGLVTQTDLVRAHARQTEEQRDLLEKAVLERTQELRESNARLERLTLEDGLMGIGNRRAMEKDLDQVHERALRYGRPYGIILIDLDYFKNYNDSYGHAAGDKLLKRMAEILSNGIRNVDTIHRYGGEEILIVLPETILVAAEFVARRLQKIVDAEAIPHTGSHHDHVTASCGVAATDSFTELPRRWDLLVSCADRALYRAKAAGRNCVEVAESSV